MMRCIGDEGLGQVQKVLVRMSGRLAGGFGDRGNFIESLIRFLSKSATPAVLPGYPYQVVIVTGACRYPAACMELYGVAGVDGKR